MATRIAAIRPRAVFLDFAPESGQKNKLAHSTELAHLLARIAPDLPRVAVGRYSEPQGAVAALRAGVTDFIALNAIDEVGPRVRALLRLSGHAKSDASYRSLLVLGCRPGIGAPTLKTGDATDR